MKSKKLIALLLAVVMIFSLCACGGPDLSPLYGTWTLVEYVDEETATGMLQSLDFYDSEIALADLSGVGVVKYATFNEDGTYSLSYDYDSTYAMMLMYFDNLMNTLYEQRASLTQDYGEPIMDMSKEDFLLAYAELFGLASYDELLVLYADNCLNYDVLAEGSETGTFKPGSAKDEILCSVDGIGAEEILRFEVSGTTLTLIYSDGTEVYTKG